MKLSSIVILLIYIGNSFLQAQCPEIESTSVTPNCIPDCELCSGDQFTIKLTGNDLPNGGKIEYYFNSTPNYNPYQGQGTLLGTSNITTPGGNCRICPELIGFLIDACGTEQDNEFIVMWTGSGFNTSNFVFDYATQNNTGGGPNADIGGGCGIQAGGAASIGGCSATQVGAGYDLPANAIWVIFCSSNASTSYDFSSVCGLGLKVFVSKSTCARTIGAFSNVGASGTRTQGFSINGCACGTSVTYDCMDPDLMGNGDAWAGGITNGGCAASITGAGTYIPAKSTITPFTYTIPNTWCNKTYEIVGIVNPKPDPMCCKEIFTERFSITVKCPVANKATLEVCDDGTGKGKFILEDAESTILGSSGGTVEWFRDAGGTIAITSPYTTVTTTVYARIKEGNCLSPLVPVELKVTPFTSARGTMDEKCGDINGYATFPLLNLENFIKNGNNTVMVKFYEDINKSSLIVPPLFTQTITIYATTCRGDCESLPVPIKLIVNPQPIAKNINKIECPELDGKGTFDLNNLSIYIKDSVKNNTVTFFKDSTLKDTIFSPFRTDSSTLIALVSDGKCINFSKVNLKVGALNFSEKLLIQKCRDINGQAVIDLYELIKKIQGGDTSINVSYFKDSSLTMAIFNTYTINQSTRIFAYYQKSNCRSNVFGIDLSLVDQPVANSLMIERCGIPEDEYEFDTDSLKLLVNPDPGVEVEFFKDPNLTQKVKGKFYSNSDTLYAISILGDCLSPASIVRLNITPTPNFYKATDTLVCTLFILDSLKGKFISSNASYTSQRDGQGQKYKPGDEIKTSQYIFRFDNNNGCIAQDSFLVQIKNRSNAGYDTIINVCEGSLVDLNTILSKADPGGTFREVIPSGKLNGSKFDTKGLSGSKIVFNYIVPSASPCLPDTSILNVQVSKSLSPGLDTTIDLCSIDSINLSTLLRNADPGGIFEDVTGKKIGQWLKGTDYGFGLYTFKYTVGDGLLCPIKSSNLNIRFQRTTIIDAIPDVNVCNYYVLQPITGVNTFNRSSYFSLSNRRGVIYSAGDTIKSNIKLFVIGTDLSYCTNEISFNINISQQTNLNIAKTDLCPDFKLNVGSDLYDINHPSGSTRIPASNSKDCDTIYTVSLQFLPPTIYNLDTSICEGNFIIINGTRYDQTNMSGQEILKNASSKLCDSIINVRLSIIKLPATVLDSTLCSGQSIIVNGNTYNESNPSGIERLTTPICDSLVQIRLNFYPPIKSLFTSTLCKDDSLIINGRSYHFNQSSGQEILKSSKGCDSTVDVQLSFYKDASFNYSATLCNEDSIKLGSIIFNKSNPVLKTILRGSSFNGCDSAIDINILFLPEVRSQFTKELCKGNFLTINNKRYDELNPSGIETFKKASTNGCDSVVDIALQFKNSVTTNLFPTICLGDSIKIASRYYSALNTSGVDTIFGGSVSGCDSILRIQATILNPSIQFFNQTLCPDEELIINGIRYNMSNPKGRETLSGQAVNGCDSIIDIDIAFSELNLSATTQYQINAGEQIQFDLKPEFTPVKISWSPANYLSCSDCLNPIAKPDEDIQYTVTLEDTNGCQISLLIRVSVSKDTYIYIPNVFSPNGDQINDFFEVFSNSNLLLKSLRIYDRWGAEVYSIENTTLTGNKFWDGNFNNKACNPGVYVYYLVFRNSLGQEKKYQGDITLIR